MRCYSRSKKILSNGWVWSIADQGVVSIATFLAGVLVARSVTKEEYGSYILVLTLIIFLLGFHRAIIVIPYTVLSQKLINSERARLLGSATFITAVTYLIFVVIFFPLAKYKTNQNLTSLASLLPWFAIACGPYLFREFFRSSLLADLQSMSSCISNLVASICHLFLLAWFWYGSGLDARTALLSLALGSSIGALIMAFRQAGVIRLRLHQIVSDAIRFLQAGKWYVCNIFWFNVASQSLPWLMVTLHDSGEVAKFGACLSMASLLAPLQRGINSFLLPKMARAYSSEGFSGLQCQLRTGILFTLGPNILWLLISSLVGGQLMGISFGPDYSLYGHILGLLAFKMCLEGISGPLTTALQAIDAPKATTVTHALNAVIVLVAGWPAIALWGATGAACSAVLTSGIGVWIKGYALYRQKKAASLRTFESKMTLLDQEVRDP